MNLKPFFVCLKLVIFVPISVTFSPPADFLVSSVAAVVASVVVVVASVVVVVASVVVVVVGSSVVVVVGSSVVVVVASVVVVVASVTVVSVSSLEDSMEVAEVFVAIVSTLFLPNRLLMPEVLSSAQRMPIARKMITRKVIRPARPGSFLDLGSLDFLDFLTVVTGEMALLSCPWLAATPLVAATGCFPFASKGESETF